MPRAERILVCGSRTFSDRQTIAEILMGVHFLHRLYRPEFDGLVVVHGAAQGADAIAGEWVGWAEGLRLFLPDLPEVTVDPHPAEWNVHHPDWCPGAFCRAKSYCMRAGHKRNQEMADSGIDRAFAFIDKPLPKSRGTNDMIYRLKDAGVPTTVIRKGCSGGHG